MVTAEGKTQVQISLSTREDLRILKNVLRASSVDEVIQKLVDKANMRKPIREYKRMMDQIGG